MLVVDGVDNPAALKTAKALAALLFASKNTRRAILHMAMLFSRVAAPHAGD